MAKPSGTPMQFRDHHLLSPQPRAAAAAPPYILWNVHCDRSSYQLSPYESITILWTKFCMLCMYYTFVHALCCICITALLGTVSCLPKCLYHFVFPLPWMRVPVASIWCCSAPYFTRSSRYIVTSVVISHCFWGWRWPCVSIAVDEQEDKGRLTAQPPCCGTVEE